MATRPYTRGVRKPYGAGWLIRVGLFILTFAIALTAFRNGVTVSDRPSVEVAPVYVICTDDDQVNLRTAIMLRSRRKNVHISVRCDYRSALTEVLSVEHEFSVLAVDTMLRRTMAERMGEWTGVESS